MLVAQICMRERPLVAFCMPFCMLRCFCIVGDAIMVHGSWSSLARYARSSDHGEGAWGMISSCGLLSQRALVSDQESSQTSYTAQLSVPCS